MYNIHLLKHKINFEHIKTKKEILKNTNKAMIT